MRRGRRLTGEDERLWASVARQAVPLKGKRHPAPPEAGTVAAAPGAAPKIAPKRSPRAAAGGKPAAKGKRSIAGAMTVDGLVEAFGAGGPPAPASGPRLSASAPPLPMRENSQHPIERPVRRKIARGRIAIEARLDLHEMTQGVAHDQLVRFLRQAQAMGLRHILVITGCGGSGFGSRGILRRVVPLWFAGPEFRPLVSGFESAERHHGGDGAFYVRVRRIG